VSTKLLRVASDDRLVELVRGGSQPAFEVLYDRHHRGILSFCRHMLGSREEGEDALQHTFMAAYKSLLGGDGKIQLRAWLYTIARNRCLSILRARRDVPSDDIEIASTVGLAAQVEQREDLRDLLRDLAELPEEQRAAIVLSEIGDLAHDDVAAVLGCQREKVKALVFQARSSLHQSRDARETSCEDIREMLATLKGGALRRTELRRHVRDCAGCRAFESETKRQRKAMAVLLPVVPTLGLKDSALAAAFGQTAAGGAAVAGGAAAVAGGGAAAAGGGLSAVAAKVAVVAALAGGGAAGVNQVVDDGPSRSPAPKKSTLAPAGAPGGPAATAAPAGTPDAADERSREAAEKARAREKKADERARARGKELAESRGRRGNTRGLRGTQPGRTREKVDRRESAEIRRAQAEARRDAARRRRAERRQQAGKSPRRPQRPAPQPRPEKPPKEPTPEPEPAPEPTPEPTVVPTPEATATSGKPGKNGRVKS